MKLFKREKYISRIRPFFQDTEMIKVITGIRRSGKSSLMQTISEELMEQGVSKENILFYNLDKYGYKNIKTSEALEELLFGCEHIRESSMYSSMKYRMLQILTQCWKHSDWKGNTRFSLPDQIHIC